jgi:hypothetical protein
MSTKLLYCNDYDPTPSGAAYMYAFAQKQGETLGDAVVRAAHIVFSSGVEENGPYKGANHVMANNAAFAFSDELLADLKSDENSHESVVVAVELIEARKRQVRVNEDAEKLQKYADDRQSQGKHTAHAFAQAAANKAKEEAAANNVKCHNDMKRIARLLPKVA